MRRLNCFARKEAAAEPPPLPARPISVLPLRARYESVKPELQVNIVQIKKSRVQLQPLLKPARNAMNNAVHHGADDGNATPRKYIEISDDEDEEGDIIDLQEPRVRAHNESALQQNNLPSHAPNGHGLLQPGAAPSPPGQVQADSDLGAFIIEDGDDLDVNDPILAPFMMEGFNREHDEHAAGVAQCAYQPQPDLQNQADSPHMAPMLEARIQIIDQVMLIFPDICRDYVSELYATVAQTSDFLIVHILDKTDKGTQYPKAKDTQNRLKRKRELNEDEEAAKKYGSVDRVIPNGAAGLRPYIRGLISKDFSETPMNFIDTALNQSGYRLFSTYRVLEEAHRTFDPYRPPYNKIKHQRRMEEEYNDLNLEGTIQGMIQTGFHDEEVEILRELQAARRVRKKAEIKRQAEILAEIEEENNLRGAQAEGTMGECGCCFGDYPMNRMVHCNNDIIHFFCRACAKQNADADIGNSKYELCCMSMDGCSASFSVEQRNLFLDEPTIIALERNEQEAVLRMAGIENLASCPFCPYAAEYPPIEIDREFRCQAPDCEKTSCRLCKLESHIPKSCEEHAKDTTGLSVRRQIEEAMSAALIRRCNKCGTPFVKEEGCNKMTCTRNGCRNVQCYVCSKSCQYDHFDDTQRGGKSGNCPLFESVEERHNDEVKKAEKEAFDKVRAEHPEYTEDDLKVKMSENVKQDDERRKANDPRNLNIAAGVGLPGRLGDPPAIIYGFGPRPAYPVLIPGVRPAAPDAPAAPGARGVMPIPHYAQEMFADVNFDGHFDDDMFVGLWDNLPGFDLEQQGQGERDQPLLQPPPAPRLYPFGHRSLHRVLRPAVDQQAAGVHNPNLPLVPAAPAQQNLQPPPFGYHVRPVQGAGQDFPNVPRRSPRVANPGRQPPQSPMAFDLPGNFIADQGQRFQEIQNNLVNLQHLANGGPPQQPENQAAQQIHNQQRQLPWMHPNGGVNYQQAGIMERAAASAAPRGQMSRHVGRGGPLKPPNGQA